MFKYIGVFFRGIYKIIFYYPKLVKYSRNTDKYTIEERYAFVRKLATIVVKATRMDLSIEGIERLKNINGTLITPNHQSIIDPVILIYLSEKPLIFVSKIEVGSYPIVGRALRVIDSHLLDRDNLKESGRILLKCRDNLLDNKNVVIFPEGTRSSEGNRPILELKGGSFKPVMQAKKDILPIVINGSYKVMSKKKYKKDRTVSVKILPLYKYITYRNKNTVEIAKSVENKMNEVYKKRANCD